MYVNQIWSSVLKYEPFFYFDQKKIELLIVIRPDDGDLGAKLLGRLLPYVWLWNESGKKDSIKERKRMKSERII